MLKMITKTNPKTGAEISYPAPAEPVAAIDNTTLVKEFRAGGGMVLHMRPRKRRFEDNRQTRGLTIAFVLRSGRIELATAVQHRTDCFSKKVGTKTAIEHFRQGKTISLPLKPGEGIITHLQMALGHLV